MPFFFLFSLVVTIPIIPSRSLTFTLWQQTLRTKSDQSQALLPKPTPESTLLASASTVIWTLHIQGSQSQSVVFSNSGFYHMQNTFKVIHVDVYMGTLFHLIATQYVIGTPCFVYPSHPGTPELLPLWGHHD